MKKMISFFVCLLFLITSKSYAGWDELIGCYKTLEWNGVAVPANDYGLTTKISKDVQTFFTVDTEGRPLPGFNFLLYQSDNNNGGAVYGYAVAFSTLGEYRESRGLNSFEFQGMVRYAFQPEILFHLNNKVEFRKLEGDKIWLHNFIKIEETNDFNEDDTYLLEKTSCSQ